MIYKWQPCKASATGNVFDCLHCINWRSHVEDQPNCHCNHHLEFFDPRESDLVNLEKLSSISNGIVCSRDGRSSNRDYPLYHIDDSIIDPMGEVPNPPFCESCRH